MKKEIKIECKYCHHVFKFPLCDVGNNETKHKCPQCKKLTTIPSFFSL